MSTPSNSRAAAKTKPKRPLSGYNLFYRYKRNKILEATSDPDHDNEAIIRTVLTAPLGLEGISPASPLFRLPPAQLGQFRIAAIRNAMEGKLFPNENARDRVHRKVHGMGFVEMSKMMRLMWGQADKLAKDLFNELADVGRVRYRRLMAEYKLNYVRTGNVQTKSEAAEESVESSMVETAAQPQTSINSREAKAPAAKSTISHPAAALDAVDPIQKEAMANISLSATDANTEAKAKAAKLWPIPNHAQSSPDPMLEALPLWARKNPPPDVAAAAAVQLAKPKKKEGLMSSYGRRVSTGDINFQGSVPCQARSFGRSRSDLFEPLSFKEMVNPTTSANVRADTKEKPDYGRRGSTATELDLCDDSLFEPLPVETRNASTIPSISNQSKWGGRRASTGHCPLPPTHNSMGGTVTDNSIANKWGGRRASTGHCPLPPTHNSMGGNVTDNSIANKWGGRRASTGHCPLSPTHNSMGGTVTDNSIANSSSNTNPESWRANLELRQTLIRSEMKKIHYQIAQNNSLLPPEMQVHTRNSASGNEEKAYLDIMASSRPSLPNSTVVGGDNPEEEGVSARDFMDFIGELDDAIDDRSIKVNAIEKRRDLSNVLADNIPSIDSGVANGAIEGKENTTASPTDRNIVGVEDSFHAYVFGKPMSNTDSPDSEDKSVSPSQVSIPMPASVELKTNRARMA